MCKNKKTYIAPLIDISEDETDIPLLGDSGTDVTGPDSESGEDGVGNGAKSNLFSICWEDGGTVNN